MQYYATVNIPRTNDTYVTYNSSYEPYARSEYHYHRASVLHATSHWQHTAPELFDLTASHDSPLPVLHV